MKKSLFVSYLLVLIGMLMPIVPVFPHHHHADGRICMKNDLHHGAHEEESCGHGTHGCHHEQGCNEADCLTTHFFRQGRHTTLTIKAPTANDTLPNLLSGLAVLFNRLIFSTPTISCPFYQEKLHDSWRTLTGSLRAPPSFA